MSDIYHWCHIQFNDDSTFREVINWCLDTFGIGTWGTHNDLHYVSFEEWPDSRSPNDIRLKSVGSAGSRDWWHVRETYDHQKQYGVQRPYCESHASYTYSSRVTGWFASFLFTTKDELMHFKLAWGHLEITNQYILEECIEGQEHVWD
jgi:hypothetical protein